MNRLFPLTVSELGSDFVLKEVLQWGTLPQVCTAEGKLLKSETLKTYIDVYLREEIREEQIIRRLDPFARFLEVAAQSSGKIVNLSRLGREANTDAKSISRYFQILEETLIGFFLEPYHASIRKRQRQQAKFYFFDLGVQRALEGTLRQEIVEKTYEFGRLFENFIILEFHRLNDYQRSDYRFSYLKTSAQHEVDIIAERAGDETFVIEIKSGEDVDISEINKLATLARDIPNSRPLIFCRTNVDRVVNNVEVIGWERGLQMLFPPE
jgi:predicted AAA+ superfamily ATPase